MMFLVIPYAYVHMDSFPINRMLQPKENNEAQIFKNTLARMQNILRASKQARGRSREESCDIEIALLRNRSVKEFGTSPVGLSVSK